MGRAAVRAARAVLRPAPCAADPVWHALLSHCCLGRVSRDRPCTACRTWSAELPRGELEVPASAPELAHRGALPEVGEHWFQGLIATMESTSGGLVRKGAELGRGVPRRAPSRGVALARARGSPAVPALPCRACAELVPWTGQGVGGKTGVVWSRGKSVARGCVGLGVTQCYHFGIGISRRSCDAGAPVLDINSREAWRHLARVASVREGGWPARTREEGPEGSRFWEACWSRVLRPLQRPPRILQFVCCALSRDRVPWTLRREVLPGADGLQPRLAPPVQRHPVR